jgi:tRNA (mo5U34)-methyltransferase
MIADAGLYQRMRESGLASWAEALPQQIEAGMSPERHGNFLRWQEIVDALPNITADELDFNADAIRIQSRHMDVAQREFIKSQLKQLMPWRKGPFDIHGIYIDTEWRSDWKWQRLQHHIQPLKNRVVLDVGCGSGYHGWRMLGAGARLVIGIDPTLLFVMQFQAIKHFAGDVPFYVLPLGIEAVPDNLRAFDTVFSMGILYHRRSPLDHLTQLRGCLKPGGELVLETLVIEGDAQQILMPRERYARMRNVWFIPSCDAVALWLHRCGFVNIKCVDECPTTPGEQRRTQWMDYESLADFLDPENPTLTIEGYPAPRRAVFTATAP